MFLMYYIRKTSIFLTDSKCITFGKHQFSWLIPKKTKNNSEGSDEELSDEERRNMLRQSMHETWDRSKHAQQQRYSSNMRTIILLVVIVVLGYFIFNGLDDVDTVVKKLV